MTFKTEMQLNECYSILEFLFILMADNNTMFLCESTGYSNVIIMYRSNFFPVQCDTITHTLAVDALNVYQRRNKFPH